MEKRIFSKSKWIWLGERKINQYADFFTEFFLEERDAALRISAHSNYELYINGEFVYAGQYPDYNEYKIYDEFNLQKRCRKGKNTLAVRCWYIGEDTFSNKNEKAGLLFEVVCKGKVVSYSDEHIYSREDRCYKTGERERFSPQLGFTFAYNANYEDGWKTELCEGFTRSVVVEKNCRLFPRPNSLLVYDLNYKSVLCSQGDFLLQERMQTPALDASSAFTRHRDLASEEELLSAKLPSEKGYNLKSAQTGVYALVDMGEETSGFVRLDFEVPCETEVIVAFGEHLKDLRVRSYIEGRNFAFTYFARPGRNVWQGNLRRLGLRYVQLYFLTKSVTLYDCRVLRTCYPVVKKPVEIKDGLFRKIYENGIRTLENCMHEHYEDCPWREQALYGMDSRNQMLFGYYAFENNSYAESNLRLMAHGQSEDGLLDMCFPSRAAITIPSFSLYFIIAVAENYEYAKNTDFAKEMIPVAERILDCFESRRDETGLVPVFTETRYWNFYEWKEGLDGGTIFRKEALPLSYDSCLNLLYLIALQKFSELLESTGRPSQYTGRIRELKNAIVKGFFDESRQAFAAVNEKGKKRLYAQLPQALAIVTGCLPEANRSLLARLRDNSFITLSLSNKIWAYEAILRADEENLNTVLEDIGEVFGPMATSGDSTLYETEHGASDFRNAGSLCHGWSAVPCYIFQRYAKGKI